MKARQVQEALQQCANPDRAEHNKRFFKTARGEYGEGDIFNGTSVPDIRKVARQFKQLSLAEIETLLRSKIHEERLLALIILVQQFKAASKSRNKSTQEKIYNFYLKNYRCVNNWDLVDISCRDIVGTYLLDKNDRETLYQWARSGHLWKKRIAIISTWTFIRQRQLTDTLGLAEILLRDKHDLIHKAAGWMLREVGNQDQKTLLSFLDKYAGQMPRIMLRYAIEKLEGTQRNYYLKKNTKTKPPEII